MIKDESVTSDDVEEVDVIVGNVNPQLLKYCKQLKLLQLNSAGTDGLVNEEPFENIVDMKTGYKINY